MDRSLLSPYAPWLQVGTDVLSPSRILPPVKVCIAGPRSYMNEEGMPIRDERRDLLCSFLTELHISFYDSHVFKESHGRDFNPSIDDDALEIAFQESDVVVFMLSDYESTENALALTPNARERKKRVLVWWLEELLVEGHISDGHVGDKDRMGENESTLHATTFERVKRVLRHWLLGQSP